MARRLISFAIIVAALVAAAVWFADRPGAVTVHWLGWRIDTSVPLLLAAMAAVMIVWAFVWRFLRLIFTAPGKFLASRRESRRRQGYLALSDGLAAVASGDRRRAGKLAKRADKLLADSSLTGLLSAQAAELTGDEGEAQKRLTDMTARPETAYLGLKGLLTLAQRKNDDEAALEYARRAWALGAPAADLAVILFDLQARAGQWVEAETTLAEVRRRNLMSGADLLHRQALVQLERSVQAQTAGDKGAALDLALKAHKSDLGLVEAAMRAASLLQSAGKARKAAAVIETSWQAAPHPVLVDAWIALAPMETALQRVKRVEKLVKLNPDAADGHLALAEAALAAKLWGHARLHLENAARLRPSGAVYILLARLEREERGDEAAAAAWMAKAHTAPAEPAWVCRACGRPADAWATKCPACGAVDGLDWLAPSPAGMPVPA